MRAFGIFGGPNIEKLMAKGDAKGLIKALVYQKDDGVREQAAAALVELGSDAIGTLVEHLRAPDDALQRAVADVLVSIGPPAVESVVVLLKSSDWELRAAAASILGGIGDEQVITPLISILRDVHSVVRDRAEDALKQGGSTFAPMLIKFLKESDDSGRESAARLLGGIRDANAIAPLIEALDDSSLNARNAAADALHNIGAPAVPLLLAALESEIEETRRRSALILGSLGSEQARDGLTGLLNDPEWSVRRAAAEALGLIGTSDATDALLSTFADDSDEDVRAAAASALGVIGDEKAIAPLVDSLETAEWTVRRAVSQALTQFGPRAISALNAALQHSSEAVRDAAAEVMDKIGDGTSIGSTPARGLHDPDAAKREATVSALGRAEEPSAVDALIEALADEDAAVRSSAARALGRIGDLAATDPLLAVFEDSSSEVREQAARAIGRMESNAFDHLIEMVESGGDQRASTAALALGFTRNQQAVAPLLSALRSGTDDVRTHAARSLGRFGSAAADKLISMLDDSEIDVQTAAAVALGETGDENGVKPLMTALRSSEDSLRTAAARALGKIGGTAVDSLITELRDVFWDVRVAAAVALGETGDERAVKPLEAALRDSERAVRSAAERSLEQLKNIAGEDQPGDES